jgi:hypothetical protein
LIFKFFWPEYLALIIPYSFFLIFEQRIGEVFSVWVCALIFFSTLCFLTLNGFQEESEKHLRGFENRACNQPYNQALAAA